MKAAHQVLMTDPVYNSLHQQKQKGIFHLFQQLIPESQPPLVSEVQTAL